MRPRYQNFDDAFSYEARESVRNRLRNYHMIDWIDAQPEVYIYVFKKQGNP
jgi:hypothetical protein